MILLSDWTSYNTESDKLHKIVEKFYPESRYYSGGYTNRESYTPMYNLLTKVENDQNYLIYEIPAAGFEDDEIDIRAEKNYIYITAKKRESEDKLTTYVKKSFTIKDFSTKFRLQEYYFVTEVKYQSGIITIVMIEKLPEEAKPKVFKVNEPQLLLE